MEPTEELKHEHQIILMVLNRTAGTHEKCHALARKLARS